MRHLAIAPFLLLTSALAGCASFSPDSGMGVVSEVTEKAIGKDVAFVRSADEADGRRRHGEPTARAQPDGG